MRCKLQIVLIAKNTTKMFSDKVVLQAMHSTFHSLRRIRLPADTGHVVGYTRPRFAEIIAQLNAFLTDLWGGKVGEECGEIIYDLGKAGAHAREGPEALGGQCLGQQVCRTEGQG